MGESSVLGRISGNFEIIPKQNETKQKFGFFFRFFFLIQNINLHHEMREKNKLKKTSILQKNHFCKKKS